MDQKIFNNIILLIIIAFIIKQVSPEPDSVLYILQKYINYFSYQFRKILAKLNLTTIEDFREIFNGYTINKTFEGVTFNGIPMFGNKAPSFKTSYEVAFVNFYKQTHPNISEKDIFTIYHFLQTLISIDTDQYFSTPSNKTPNNFTNDELNKIKNIILKKLNRDNFNFNIFNFEYFPKYYLNFSGKEIDPFVFNIESDIGILRIYIKIDIRNDVYQNKEYLVINEIKPLKDKQVIFTNQNMSDEISNETILDSQLNSKHIVDETNNQSNLIHNNIILNKVHTPSSDDNDNDNDYLFNYMYVSDETTNNHSNDEHLTYGDHSNDEHLTYGDHSNDEHLTYGDHSNDEQFIYSQSV